ncbi:MAG: condensation domain-containing protein, partial [Pseudomonadota bacterium]
RQLAAYFTLNEAANDEALEGAALIEALRTHLAAQLPDYMRPSSFTHLEALPLTPNGKLDRRALPEPERQINAENYVAPRNEIELALQTIWQSLLRRSPIGVHENYFNLGGDSILSIQIIARARDMGLGLSPRDLFEHQSIAELALAVQPLATLLADQGTLTGPLPLTPIQRYFFADAPGEPWHFNQAMLLTVPADIDPKALRAALAALISHHDALRLRFRRDAEGWRQDYAEPCGELPLHIEDLREMPPSARAGEMQQRCDAWQASLDLADGPLLRLVLMHLDSGQARLLWCIHHLAVDGVSWRILLEDLHRAYGQAKAGAPIELGSKTSAYRAWAKTLERWRTSEACTAQAVFWHEDPRVLPLPVDHPRGPNRTIDTRQYTLELDIETTKNLLEQAPRAYRTGINDLLLSALLLALRQWSGRDAQRIDLESHGRAALDDAIDLTRTVGWFTALYSVVLTLPGSEDLGAVIKSVKEQLRRIPYDGVGDGVLRQLGGESRARGEVVFNYLGQFDQSLPGDGLFGFASEQPGRMMSLLGERTHRLAINGLTQDRRLSLSFSYSAEQYDEATIVALAEHYRRHLKTLLAHCAQHHGITPSDFPLAGLDQAALDALSQRFGDHIAELYPLAPMQQGMLFHSLYAPERGEYVEQLHLALDGALDPEALRQAWEALLARHSVLRSAFLSDQTQPVQLVLDRVALPWQALDWRDRSAEAQRQALATLLTKERARGFDLDHAPLLRLQLIHESALRHRLVWHHHHLLLDGWSLPILFGELLALYDALRSGATAQLAPIRPYRDYIAWLQRQEPTAARTYWQTELADFTAPTPIPLPRPETPEAGYGSCRQVVPIAALQAFAKTHRLTLNTLVQGAWALLLGRYSGEPEVVFGVTGSGRQIPLAGIDAMVGLFINTLPLRVKLEAEAVVPWLGAIQERPQANNAYAHTPLADIQGWSAVPNGVALFESLLVFENYPLGDTLDQAQAAELHIAEVQAIEYTNYPLTLAVVPGKTLQLMLSYDRTRFAAADMERLLAHLQTLLEAITEVPERALAALSLLTETERHQLQAWNATEVAYPQDQTVVDLFQQQVAKTPDNTAVVFGDETLSYAELNARANRLA